MTTEKLVAGPLRGVQIAMRDACFQNMLRLIKNCHADVPEGTSGKEALAVLHESIEHQGVEGFGAALASLPFSPQSRPGHRSQEWLDGYAQACSEQGKSRAVPLNEEEVFTLLKGRFAIQGNKVAWLTDQLNKLLEVKRADAASPVQGVQACKFCFGEGSVGQADEGTLAECPYCQPAASPVQGVHSQEWLDGYAKAHSEHPPAAGQRAEGAEAGHKVPTDVELARGVRAHVLNDWQGERVEREVIRALEIVRAEAITTALRAAAPPVAEKTELGRAGARERERGSEMSVPVRNMARCQKTPNATYGPNGSDIPCGRRATMMLNGRNYCTQHGNRIKKRESESGRGEKGGVER